MFQLNADCSDDIPPDYESVGGPPTNPISAASDLTVNESSVVLDAAGRAIDLQQLHPNAETEPQAGESYIIASSEYRHHIELMNVSVGRGLATLGSWDIRFESRQSYHHMLYRNIYILRQ